MIAKIKRIASWIVWAACFIGTMIFASNYGGTVPFMLLKIVIFIPIIGLIYCIVVTSRFRFYQNITEKTVVKGEPVSYTLKMTNEDHFEYNSIQVLFHKNRTRIIGLSEDVKYTLQKGENKELNTSMCCKYRGEYETGVSHFIVRDYLHLIAIHYKPVSSYKVLVLPRITDWEYEHEVLDDKSGSNDTVTTSNGDIDVQVRNYVAGDSMRKMHWKASAHSGKLMTREECETRKNRLLIIADLMRMEELNEEDNLVYEDTLIEQVVAAAHASYARHVPCTVIVNTGKWEKFDIVSAAEWREFYDFCGKTTFAATESVDKLNYRITDMNQIRYAVYVTGRENLTASIPGVHTHIVSVKGSTSSLTTL